MGKGFYLLMLMFMILEKADALETVLAVAITPTCIIDIFVGALQLFKAAEWEKYDQEQL